MRRLKQLGQVEEVALSADPSEQVWLAVTFGPMPALYANAESSST